MLTEIILITVGFSLSCIIIKFLIIGKLNAFLNQPGKIETKYIHINGPSLTLESRWTIHVSQIKRDSKFQASFLTNFSLHQ